MKPKINFAVIMFFQFALVSLGASETNKYQKPDWKGKTEIENGIVIIKNSKTPIYSGDVFDLKKELSIGEAKGKEEYMFSEVKGIAVDDEGRIYVLDSKETHIKVFDKNGIYLRTVGKRGQGPGEMNAPQNLFITSQKEIMVEDHLNRRFVYYSLEGKFLRNISATKVFIFTTGVDSRGNIIGIVQTQHPEYSRQELQRFDSEMNYLHTMGSPVLGYRQTYNYFKPRLRWALARDDHIIFGYSEKYKLRVFDSESKEVKRIIKEYDPVKITREEKQWIKERAVLPPSVRMIIPQHHSAFQKFTVDDEGRIFVETWEKTEGEQGFFYDVFDSEGRFTAKILLKTQPWIWKRSKLYTVEEDKDEFHVVKRYRVEWKL